MDRNRSLRVPTSAGFSLSSPIESPVASPFVRIENDLEELVNALDEETNARLTAKHQSAASTTAVAAAGGPPAFPRPLSSIEVTTMTQEQLQSLSANLSKGLWVSNLDQSLTELDLRRAFEPFGSIQNLRLLPTREGALISYATLQDAVRAKDALQGTPLGGLLIRIGYYRVDAGEAVRHTPSSLSTAAGSSGESGSMVVGPGGNGAIGGAAGVAPAFAPLPSSSSGAGEGGGASRSVWVGHVGPDVDVEALQEAFSPFGQIESIRILDIKNCAFINYALADDAARARQEMNGARIGNSVIKTGLAKSNAGSRNDLELVGAGGAARKSLSSGEVAAFGGSMAAVGASEASAVVAMSTLDVAPGEFLEPAPTLPESLSLPEDMNASVIRECRRRVEHPAVTAGDIDEFSLQIMSYILPASIDPVGNILVQKLIEKGSDATRDKIIARLGKYLATVGMHKNGTWVVQRLLNHCRTAGQMAAVSGWLRPHLVPLLQDQFGNYVVQGCLVFGRGQNQFVFDALYHRCVEIATSRFGSRALRSCLESPRTSDQQRKFVAMAIISHALGLVHDVNGVIVLQWLLDSDLPGRHAFITPVLKDHFAQLCLSKHASSIVAKLVHPSADPAAREAVIGEIFASRTLPTLLQEPISGAILLRCLTTVRPEQKIHLAHLLHPHLSPRRAAGATGGEEPVHLKKIAEEVDAALSMVKLEADNWKGLDSESGFRAKTALPSHAVGGPVSSAPTAPAAKGAMGQSSTTANRSMSFGTVTTVVPYRPTEADSSSPTKPIARSDRLFFGPSLVDRVDAKSKVHRPTTPS